MAIVRQGITVFKNNVKDEDDYAEQSSQSSSSSYKTLVIAVEKTGYYNFSVGNKKYFYDERIDTSKITNHVLFVAFNGGTEESKKKKKGKITISKK